MALVGALLVAAAGFVTPEVDLNVHKWPRLNSSLEILIIVVMMAVLLFVVAYALNLNDGAVFAIFLVTVISLAAGLLGAGVGGYLGSWGPTTGTR